MEAIFSKNSLLSSVVTTVTCWKIVTCFTNVVFKVVTSLLNHYHFTRLYRCVAHTNIFLCLLFSTKWTKRLSQCLEISLLTPLEYFQKINRSLFVGCVTSQSPVEVTVPVQAPGFTKLLTTILRLNLSYSYLYSLLHYSRQCAILSDFMFGKTNCVYLAHNCLSVIIVPC
jgi:hypothetical protein